MRWDDATDADPLADFRAMVKKVESDSGLRPHCIIVSAKTKKDFEEWAIWYEVTLERLRSTPRRRFITRLVLERQLHGSLWRRSRLRYRVQRAWWRYRGEIDY